MRGKRRAPRPRIPWRSPWLPAVCLAGLLAAGGVAAVSALAKDVVLVVDGEPRAVRSSAGSVGDLLGEAGVEVGFGDIVRPGPEAELADGARVEVRHARPIKLTVDGRTSDRLVTATNVREALAELAISPAASRLSEPPDKRVPLTGMSLTVLTERDVSVVTGAARRRSLRTTARTVRELLRRERVAVPPGFEVRPSLGSFPQQGMVITVAPPWIVPIRPEVRRLHWRALAACESGGDPKARAGDGGSYGLYRFSLDMWRAAGGSGLPTEWPEDEQTYRAQLLYQRDGGTWQRHWPHCGSHLFS
ncbi:ubiquitin-like domain-containing protein [Nonomuraea pusilla]|uniref:ubiquitin-like domain-containing protein n=1 Tax=Nonomuraea pusilla TaxID=46177 RepID=UPI003331DF40